MFVLVEPQHPGNVGAVARAIANMGLRRLVLVDPPAWDPEQARWMAPGCDELLRDVRVVATLDEALDGVGRAIATTARHRRRGQPVIGPQEVATQILDDPERTTAILFGREDHGLPDSAILRCDSVLRIPTAPHASLNLGQAALLIAWELFEARRERGEPAPGRLLGGSAETSTARLDRRDRRDRPAELSAIEPAVAGMVGLLDRVGYLRGLDPAKLGVTLGGLLQRAKASVRETEAIRGMIARIGWALDHPGVDWRASRADRQR